MFFIGEIGINHNGDINVAKALINEAKEAGVDCVKFQKRTPEICVPKSEWDKVRETPWGSMTYLEYKKRIEFGLEEYQAIDEHCKAVGIEWTASVWDIPSLDFIMTNFPHVPFIKIASASLTDKDLLMHMTKNYPLTTVILSTGMSTTAEIRQACGILHDHSSVHLMHCNSSYPTPDSEQNIRSLVALNDIVREFEFDGFGYSGHEEDTLATIIACAFGIRTFERHITLDKYAWGSDHKCSLEPHEVSELIKTLNRIPVIMGDRDIRVTESEIPMREKLRNN